MASTNRTGPGVGERTMEPPFGVAGEFMRQNGPSMLASVSVCAVVAVVEEADQRRQTERARHQHRLVVRLVGVLAERHDVGHGGVKFLLGQLHLAGEVMQVANKGGHDLAQPRILDARVFAEHRLGDVFLVLDDHVLAPRWLGGTVRRADFTVIASEGRHAAAAEPDRLT